MAIAWILDTLHQTRNNVDFLYTHPKKVTTLSLLAIRINHLHRSTPYGVNIALQLCQPAQRQIRTNKLALLHLCQQPTLGRLDLTTQPNTLPALALPELPASSRLHLAGLLRRATRAAATLAAAVGLMASSLAAHAAVVNVAFTNLGGGESIPR